MTRFVFLTVLVLTVLATVAAHISTLSTDVKPAATPIHLQRRGHAKDKFVRIVAVSAHAGEHAGDFIGKGIAGTAKYTVGLVATVPAALVAGATWVSDKVKHRRSKRAGHSHRHRHW
ncbi:hypothetical protein IWQ60_002615 [Tieghemiomyces parasiticus]|uniref:Transmembrane protein n=1 Tax=Tieghemiomyces parasiticus TaxID=78921 RepID=A0A9W8E0X3_9FUNG|nr:hypothetical protein IWQ60_002615 [Tieghemiomyces parasiticus]